MLRVGIFTGFVATVCQRAAQLLGSMFLPRVRRRSVGVLHLDETSGCAASGLEYVQVAAAPFLTAMHTGGRSAADIDAGEVLPGYTGAIVRVATPATPTSSTPTTPGAAHPLRNLRAIHTADPKAQTWAAAMATTLTDTNTAAAVARAGEQNTLDPQVLATIRNHYRGAVALGISINTVLAGPPAADALALAGASAPTRPRSCASWSISPCPSPTTKQNATSDPSNPATNLRR